MSAYSDVELYKFLEFLIRKSLIKEATGKSRLFAARKILGALDDGERANLKQLDREMAFHRFENKYGTHFTPDSLTTYKSRFNAALDDFLAFVENPSGFRPGTLTRSSARPAAERSVPKTSETKGSPSARGASHELPGSTSPSGSIVFPIPIRAGVIVHVHNLPSDLTASEAGRIAAVIQALAVPAGTVAPERKTGHS